MVDGAIVMIENLHKHIERAEGRVPRWELVLASAKQVGPPLFFSLLIITFSFLPVFALEQQEGRLFKPLAFTKTFAMAGAALLSITLVPVLMGYLISGKIRPESQNPINRWLRWVYRPVIEFVVRRPWVVIAGAAVVLGSTIVPWRGLGSEFMPPLHEGSILFMPTTVPGVSIAQAREIMRHQDSVLASFPEVAIVLGKAGRATTATDPAPLDMFETTITLRPKNEWRPGVTYERLIGEMDRAVQMPGVTNAWTMPIKGRIDMLATGVRTPVGIKIFGPDLDTLQVLGERVERLVQAVPGTRSAFAERGVSGYYVDIDIDRAEAARYGLNVGDIHSAIMATVGGMTAAVTVEGRERYAVNVRYPRELRDDVEKLREVVVPAPGNVEIPLGQVASVEVLQGPMAVKTENAFPVTTGGCPGADAAYGVHASLERPIRVHAAGGRENEDRGSGHTRDHLPPALPQLPRGHGILDRDVGLAALGGRRGLVPVALRVQHQCRGLGWVHRPGGRRRGDGSDHADLPRRGISPPELGRPDAIAVRRRGRGPGGGARAAPSRDHDGHGHHGWARPDSLERWNRGGRHEANRGANGRRYGDGDAADTGRDPGDLSALARLAGGTRV
jgi:Cu(I)/Ag(I) efflux system membrane protein CusA/SilA